MNPQNQQPSAPAPMNSMPVPHKKVGPIIAILVIVLILIIGALYLFASRINQQQVPSDSTVAENSQPNRLMAPSTPEEVKPITNKADDVSALQADLNASTQGLDNQNF